ncbi:MAG: hypothetical protein MJZ67_01380 [Bacteroidales bacterium]|nr:hypothetical protein [Bacteroidales bacterium]
MQENIHQPMTQGKTATFIAEKAKSSNSATDECVREVLVLHFFGKLHTPERGDIWLLASRYMVDNEEIWGS